MRCGIGGTPWDSHDTFDGLNQLRFVVFIYYYVLFLLTSHVAISEPSTVWLNLKWGGVKGKLCKVYNLLAEASEDFISDMFIWVMVRGQCPTFMLLLLLIAMIIVIIIMITMAMTMAMTMVAMMMMMMMMMMMKMNVPGSHQRAKAATTTCWCVPGAHCEVSGLFEGSSREDNNYIYTWFWEIR